MIKKTTLIASLHLLLLFFNSAYSQKTMTQKIYENMMHYALDEIYSKEIISKKFRHTLDGSFLKSPFECLLINRNHSPETIFCRNSSLSQKYLEEIQELGAFLSLVPNLKQLVLTDSCLGQWKKDRINCFFEKLLVSQRHAETFLRDKLLKILSHIEASNKKNSSRLFMIPHVFFKGIKKTKSDQEEALGIINTLLDSIEEVGYPSPVDGAALEPIENVYAGIKGISCLSISRNQLGFLHEENRQEALERLLFYISNMEKLEEIDISDNNLYKWSTEQLNSLAEMLKILPKLKIINLDGNNFSISQKKRFLSILNPLPQNITFNKIVLF